MRLNFFLRHWKTAVAIVVIFACGALVGVLGSAWFFKRKVREFTDPSKVRRHLEGRFQSMVEELNLTPEQIAQIKPILEGQAREIRRQRESIVSEMRQIREKNLRKMMECLTPEQRRKLREMNRQRESRGQKKFFERGQGSFLDESAPPEAAPRNQ